MGGVIEKTKLFLFAKQPIKSRTEYNNQLYQLKQLVDDPKWKIFKNVLDEEKDFLETQLINTTDVNKVFEIKGQIKELNKIIVVTESKSNRNYMEEFSDE